MTALSQQICPVLIIFPLDFLISYIRHLPKQKNNNV